MRQSYHCHLQIYRGSSLDATAAGVDGWDSSVKATAAGVDGWGVMRRHDRGTRRRLHPLDRGSPPRAPAGLCQQSFATVDRSRARSMGFFMMRTPLGARDGSDVETTTGMLASVRSACISA
jgi:hypothetical protein